MAKRRAFVGAEFIPQGVTQHMLLKKLQVQNQYVSNTMAFPIQGLDQNILTTEIKAGPLKLLFREYIVKCSGGKKLKPTQYND